MPIFVCPHCGDPILIEEKDYKCCIFRHGVYKKNNKPINPHASNKECERIKNKIIGCGKPFKIDKDTGEILVCDYV
jgi:hypothetical protein